MKYALTRVALGAVELHVQYWGTFTVGLPVQDYTLAQYKPETFEHLAYSQTVNQLTTNFGYPLELREFQVMYYLQAST